VRENKETDLHRVRRQYFGIEAPRELDGQLRLARARGAENNDERNFSQHNSLISLFIPVHLLIHWMDALQENKILHSDFINILCNDCNSTNFLLLHF
jgi:hypothetical protein